jgi:pimeloyl-ACP methyl ester carboxylesterase
MGLGASSRLWYRLLPWLSRRHRVIVLDNRGTGDSLPVRSRLTMRGLAQDVVDVLDAAGEESAHVLGASMGGMIAQHVALDHRERVRSLVLACTTAGGPAGLPPWRLMATVALRPVLGAKRTFPLVAPLLYARATLDTCHDRVREDLKRRVADATSPLTVYAQMGAIALHDTRSRLYELENVSTLVVHGLEDGLVPPKRGRELAELIPGARLELVPSCSHLLTTDAEDAVATAILDHLEHNVIASPQRVG